MKGALQAAARCSTCPVPGSAAAAEVQQGPHGGLAGSSGALGADDDIDAGAFFYVLFIYFILLFYFFCTGAAPRVRHRFFFIVSVINAFICPQGPKTLAETPQSRFGPVSSRVR